MKKRRKTYVCQILEENEFYLNTVQKAICLIKKLILPSGNSSSNICFMNSSTTTKGPWKQLGGGSLWRRATAAGGYGKSPPGTERDSGTAKHHTVRKYRNCYLRYWYCRVTTQSLLKYLFICKYILYILIVYYIIV